MVNINGKSAEGLTIGIISEIVREGRARELFKIHDVIGAFGRKLEVIGFDHDVDDETEGRHTMTVFEKETSVQHRMHGGECQCWWFVTELRAWLKEQFETLPYELKKDIRPVRKVTHNLRGEEFITVDKLFLPSESELFGSAILCGHKEENIYEAFLCSKDRVRYNKEGDGCWYWTRSLGDDDSWISRNAGFVGVYNNGILSCVDVNAEDMFIPLCFNF